MPSFSFYHLTTSNTEEALPKLMEKLLDSDAKGVVLFNNQQMLESLDKAFWSVGGTRFIPHGIEADNENKELQPLYLTTKEENPNNAEYLIIAGKPDKDFYKNFEKNIIIFSSANNDELESARKLWKDLKANDNFELKYYQQDEKGSWNLKS